MKIVFDYACQEVRRVYADKPFNEVQAIAEGMISYAESYLYRPSGDSIPQDEPRGELAKIMGSKKERREHIERIASLIEIAENFDVDF